jgi:hypothetical protein
MRGNLDFFLRRQSQEAGSEKLPQRREGAGLVEREVALPATR